MLIVPLFGGDSKKTQRKPKLNLFRSPSASKPTQARVFSGGTFSKENRREIQGNPRETKRLEPGSDGDVVLVMPLKRGIATKTRCMTHLPEYTSQEGIRLLTKPNKETKAACLSQEGIQNNYSKEGVGKTSHFWRYPYFDTSTNWAVQNGVHSQSMIPMRTTTKGKPSATKPR